MRATLSKWGATLSQVGNRRRGAVRGSERPKEIIKRS